MPRRHPRHLTECGNVDLGGNSYLGAFGDICWQSDSEDGPLPRELIDRAVERAKGGDLRRLCALKAGSSRVDPRRLLQACVKDLHNVALLVPEVNPRLGCLRRQAATLRYRPDLSFCQMTEGRNKGHVQSDISAEPCVVCQAVTSLQAVQGDTRRGRQHSPAFAGHCLPCSLQALVQVQTMSILAVNLGFSGIGTDVMAERGIINVSSSSPLWTTVSFLPRPFPFRKVFVYQSVY